MTTLNVTVPDMACSACAEAIAAAVKSIDETASIEADPATKAVMISTIADAAAIKTAIATAGYTVQE